MAVSFDEFAVAWFVSGLNETLPVKVLGFLQGQVSPRINACLLYTSDAADERSSVDLGGRRIIKKKNT